MIPKPLLSMLEDVNVSFASVPSTLADAKSRGVLWQAAPGRFHLDVPGIARYLVEFGKRVTIDIAPGVDTEAVERFFRMAPLAALLCQREILPLHAACAVYGEGAVIFAGDSGAGKSTLLAALLRRGWNLVSDDLTILEIGPSGKARVCPVSPEVALWPDAQSILSSGTTLPTKAGNRHDFPLVEHFCSYPQSISSIFHLSTHNDARIDVAPLNGAAAFQTVGLISYNSHITDALFDRLSFMRFAAALTSSTPLYQLRRPRGHWSVEELADLVSRGIQ